MTENNKTKKTKVETLPKIWVGNEEVEVANTVNAQIILLSMKTPPQYIKQRKGRGGGTFDYVEMNYVVGRLNATFLFNWDCDVLEQIIDKENSQVALKVKLTARFADGTMVSKTAWGGSDISRYSSGDGKIISLADDLKSAEADGLKKAASMLGVCWDVYAGLTKNGKQKKKQQATEEPGIADYPQSDREAEFRTIPITIGKKTVMHTKFEALDRFQGAKKQMGKEVYYKILGELGYEKSNQIPNKDIPKVYYAMREKWEEINVRK